MLYIYSGSEDYKISTKEKDYVYHLNTGSLISRAKCLDDLKQVYDIALDVRDDYVKYINSLNKLFINNKLIYEGTISLFYFSDLFNKRTEIFDTYVSICHILFIKEILRKHKGINSITTICCSSCFNTALESIIDGIEYEKIYEKNEKINATYIHLSQVKFFFISIIKLLVIKCIYKEKKEIPSEKLYLTRYPLHCDNKYFDDKYGELAENKNDSFLISMLTDGMHQNINLINLFKHLKILNSKSNTILLDHNLKLNDFIMGYINHLSLNMRSKVLYNKKYIFREINISKYIFQELRQSFNRIPRLLLYRSAFLKSLSNLKTSKVVFYLHEYSYGRYFNYILAKYFSSIERIGFQHGPAAKRKLLYYIGNDIVSNKSNDWLYKMPIPNTILAEDELSKEVYEEAGYKNIKIMKNIYRLEYLKKIKRENIESNLILIVPGLHDGLLLLNKLQMYIMDHPEKKFILKPHPRSYHFINGIPVKYNLNNISVGNQHISDYLGKVSEIIVTYSSVGFEAYLLGIPIKLVCLNQKINESPLLDIYESVSDKQIEIIW